MVRETILRIADASGSRAHFLDDPLQRAVRDINTLSSHVVFNRDRAGEVYGKVALGLEYAPAVV